MDLSSVLLMKTIDDVDSEGTDPQLAEGEGIYSIVVESYNGTFAKCFKIRVDRSPSSTYSAPPGYVKMTSAESISIGGVHIVEEYLPSFLLILDTMILLIEGEINPSEGAASGIEFKVMTKGMREDLYANLHDVEKTFNTLLKVAGSSVGIGCNAQSVKCLKELHFGHDVVGTQFIDGLLRKRITPASFMQIIYEGFGLIVVQTELDEWVLTDIVTMISNAEPIQVDMKNIASMRTAYDYKKIAKSSHIALDNTGSPTTSVTEGGNMPETIAQIS